MKIVFIGASHWHLPLYLDPLLALDDIEVVGVSDPDAAKTAALASRLGCLGDSDYRELCRRAKPDFVFALGRHCDMMQQAAFLIDEGIAFALEKPCGLDRVEVEAIAAAARAAGAFAAVPLVFRNGAFAALLQEEAARGGAQYATFRFMAGFPERYRLAGSDWMLDPALSGGGSTINLGIHFFDLCLTLFGPEVEVTQSLMTNAAWGLAIEDYSAVTLRHGSRVCQIETGYIYPGPTSTFDMHFTLRTPSSYVIARDQTQVDILANDGVRRTVQMGTTNVSQYAPFVRDVLDRASAGRAPLATLSDMVPIMRLVDDAYAMAGTAARRPVAADAH